MTTPLPLLVVTRTGLRIELTGEVRTPPARDQLRDLVIAALEDCRNTGGIMHEIVLDVSDAKYFDTAALATLIRVGQKCVDAGCTLSLEGANDDLLEQLRTTKIDQVLRAQGTTITPTKTRADEAE